MDSSSSSILENDVMTKMCRGIMAEVFDVQPLQVSDISPENLSDILSRISPVVLSDILSSKCPDISSDILPACWGPAWEHWPRRIAVEVRQGTLAAEDRGWGPAGNTGSRGSRFRSGREHWHRERGPQMVARRDEDDEDEMDDEDDDKEKEKEMRLT